MVSRQSCQLHRHADQQMWIERLEVGGVRQRAERVYHCEKSDQVSGQEHEGAWDRHPAVSDGTVLRSLCRGRQAVLG